MKQRPVVAVSACLLGQKVRYDGQDKYTSLIAVELNKYCQLIPVCPEVEIGLGVPREKIQLTQVGSTIKVLTLNEAKVDVSAALISFAKQFVLKKSFSGLVLQDKSPSCGVNNTKLYSETGQEIGLSSGLFSATVMSLIPNIVIVQESQLQNKNEIKSFLDQLDRLKMLD
ncbi:MAG: DUF523 domain-containing protein [Methylococcaceae bacterium]|nr:DUF523 domain-containing protein [Methylococcaceae bacterium]